MDPMINRRTLLGTMSLLLAGPLAVEAQQAGKVARIGVLSPFSRAPTLPGNLFCNSSMTSDGWRGRTSHSSPGTRRAVSPDFLISRLSLYSSRWM